MRSCRRAAWSGDSEVLRVIAELPLCSFESQLLGYLPSVWKSSAEREASVRIGALDRLYVADEIGEVFEASLPLLFSGIYGIPADFKRDLPAVIGQCQVQAVWEFSPLGDFVSC